ncbi:MAG: Fe-S cluster assembly protein SufD [Ilumatobacteraceae bacterium]
MSVIDLTHLADVELPTADAEIWRYSRIGELDLAKFTPTEHHVDVADVEDLVAATGIVDLFGEAPDVFAGLNRSAGRTLHLVVPPRTTVADPIVITHRVPGGGALSTPRLVVEVGVDAEVTVIERFVSASEGPALTLPVLQVRAAAASRVRYLAVNELSPEAWSIGHQQTESERDSSLLLSTVALGGDYARVRTEARSIGPGASTRQVALYFADGDQMHDFRVIQEHVAPHTSSDLLFKGAVQDRSASVYTGLISIGEEARGTAAYQTNRTLTLSDGAWAESVPNLDIRTNDVKCSHASTVGPIDDDQRFYLESRGITPEVAERLVVLGFFDEVLAQLPVADLAADLRSRVAAKLKIGESA